MGILRQRRSRTVGIVFYCYCRLLIGTVECHTCDILHREHRCSLRNDIECSRSPALIVSVSVDVYIICTYIRTTIIGQCVVDGLCHRIITVFHCHRRLLETAVICEELLVEAKHIAGDSLRCDGEFLHSASSKVACTRNCHLRCCCCCCCCSVSVVGIYRSVCRHH